MSDLRSLTWRQFESFIGELFREQGYFVMETPEGPDNGVDLVLRKDCEKTYVQCKHWKAASEFARESGIFHSIPSKSN